jgi:hypothetical protein
MAVPPVSWAEGSAPIEVKRAIQTNGDQRPFACKWYASAACSLRRQDPVGHEGDSMFERLYPFTAGL